MATHENHPAQTCLPIMCNAEATTYTHQLVIYLPYTVVSHCRQREYTNHARRLYVNAGLAYVARLDLKKSARKAS